MAKVYKGSIVSLETENNRGRFLYAAGRFKEAAEFFQNETERQKQDGNQPRVSDFTGLAKSFFALQDFDAAIDAIKQALSVQPDQRVLKRFLGVCYSLSCNYAEAVEVYEGLLQGKEDDWVVLDGLAHCYHNLKQEDRSIVCGRKSLEAKDAAVFSKRNPAHAFISSHDFQREKETAPSFQTRIPERNVISYSLWGRKTFYLDGAVENARLARVIYPGWVCRFYCDDSVPEKVIGELRRYGAKVVMMPLASKAYEGLFWRFQVANDPTVERYLVRDADSPLTCQERLAVDEWIASGKRFHIIRDWFTHSELILAGLCGGVRGALPDLKPLIDSFYGVAEVERTIDQRFLRWYVWPLIKDDHLAHDEYFLFGKATRFPAHGRNGTRMHVGANWHVFDGKKRQRVFVSSKSADRKSS